ncbi:SDR family NAD(P)-dependent oxidoreductase [Nocardia sp. NPDC057353]|uniref:SDR family NAD(P)-dependent oxidoreductase n=1 Tax=Nocardia sp. NPDC057353 TaxID=3346104 RepID=UPI003642B876
MTALLDGKVAVVTGAAGGIGLATARRFAEAGAKVVIGDIQDELGAAAASDIGASAVYRHADVTDEAEIEGLARAAVDEFGRLDVFVNNAGAQGDPAPIIDLTADGFDRTLALLTRSALLGHKVAARMFREQGSPGSIITTASAAALQGGWSTPSYTIAKHALVGLVRQAAIELGGLGIRSNAIAPGIIKTPLMARTFGVPAAESDAFVDHLENRLGASQPLGRLGTAEEIADVALFLACDLARYVTGTVIPVDGGATAVTLGTFATDVVAAAAEFTAARG